MLPRGLITSPLIAPAERPAVEIREVRKPSRFRTWLVFYHLARLGAVAFWLRVTMRLTPAEYARQLRGFLRRMGTIWVRAGQLMGMRSDLLPPEFTMELARIRDQGPGFPFAAARQVVEDELHAPLERYFDEFEPTPFAATTGFQLHRARLRREQVWVAVKVLRPHAEQAFAHDFGLMRRVTGLLRLLRLHQRMRWGDLCREIEEAMVRELDLRYEASSLKRLQKTLPKHGIYVPDVFSEYCTQRVLVMEYIQGALIADYVELRRSDPQRLACWLEERNIEPRKVAQRLFLSLWRQVLEDNLFHADMTPYNVVLLPNSRLAVLDCRSVGSLEAESLDRHRMFIRAVATGQYSTAAERSFLLLFRLPLTDLGEVKAQFVRVWRRWETRNYVRTLPVEDKSLTRMFDELNRIMYRRNFEVDWSMAKFAWTVVNADVSISQLVSEINYITWLRHYLRGADHRSNRIRPEEMARHANLMMTGLADMPRRVSESTMALQDILRRQARVLQASTTKSGFFLATVYGFLATGVLLAGAVFSCALAWQHFDVSLEPWLGGQLSAGIAALPTLDKWIWIALLLLVLYGYRRFSSLKKSYLQRSPPMVR